MNSIQYRITNDRGLWIASRPWHVESNIGNGWSRTAVCKTQADASAHIKLLQESDSREDEALMLGHFTS